MKGFVIGIARQAVARAEQDCVPQSSRDLAPAGLRPLGRVAEDEGAALEAARRLVGARA